jgi:hypothetical protein
MFCSWDGSRMHLKGDKMKIKRHYDDSSLDDIVTICDEETLDRAFNKFIFLKKWTKESHIIVFEVGNKSMILEEDIKGNVLITVYSTTFAKNEVNIYVASWEDARNFVLTHMN